MHLTAIDSTYTPQRNVAQKIAKYNELALPVTEEGKKLKGVITWMMQ